MYVNYLFMNDEKKTIRGIRLDQALREAGLTRANFVRLLSSDKRFKDFKSQNLNNWLIRGAPGGKLHDIEEVVGINAKWLQKGETPVWLRREFVTEILQTDQLESGSLENPIMNTNNNGSISDVINALEEFKDSLYEFRIAPVVGKIEKQDGQTMLVEQNLGSIGVYSGDPTVKCYEETTNEYYPRVKSREVVIVTPATKPQPLDEVVIITNDNYVEIKELASKAEDGYYVDDINGKTPRLFIEEAKVKDILVITDIYRARLEARPFVPKIPPWVKDVIEQDESVDNTEC